MKKFVAIALGLCVLGTVAVKADDKEKGKPDQKAFRKEMLEKYDANKDGKIDKEEKAKISSEDKEKMKKANAGHHKKGEDKKDK